MPPASRSSLAGVTDDSPYPIKVTLYRLLTSLTAFVVMVSKPVFGYTNNNVAATTVDFCGSLSTLILLIVGWWENVTPKGWWDTLHQDRGKLLWHILHSYNRSPSRSHGRFTRRQDTLNWAEQGGHIELLPQGHSMVGPSSIMATARQDPSSREVGLRDRRKHISQWLSAPDHYRHYMTAREVHVANTNSWFISDPQFIEWQKNTNSFIWIYGAPGSGKTVLCSTVIEHVTNLCEADASIACAYFFFVYRDTNMTHTSFIRSLITQLFAKHPDIPTSLQELYENRDHEPSIDSLQNTLQQIINEFNEVYIFVDALDECATLGDLLTWLKHIAGLKAGKFHLFVTSCPETDILESLKDITFHRKILGERSMKSDLKAYLDVKIQEGRLGALPEEVQSRIKEKLLEKAQGMFLFLSIQLRELQNSLDDNKLEAQLNRLPESLDETYSGVLARIPEQRRTAAKVYLQWTAFSERRMRLEELGEAAAFAFDHEGVPRYDNRRRYETQDVLDACAGLIIASEGYARLSHLSVKDYLMSEHISNSTVSYFGLDERLSHSHMSRICLACLLRLDSPESLSHDTHPDFPLARYAAENWVFHMRLGAKDEDHVSQNLILKLLESTAQFTNWIRLWDPDKPSRGPKTDISSSELAEPLYYASLLGLTGVLRALLERGAGPEGRGMTIIAKRIDDSKALEASSRGGYLEVVRLLLQYGANVNAQGMRFDTALQAATVGRHVEIVQMLLQHRADVHAKGGMSSALQVASERGDTEIMSLLEDAAKHTPRSPQAAYSISGRTLASATELSGLSVFSNP